MTCVICNLGEHALDNCKTVNGTVAIAEVKRVAHSAFITGYVFGSNFPDAPFEHLCELHAQTLARVITEANGPNMPGRNKASG